MKHAKNFIVMCGAEEATARMGYLPPEASLRKCGSMGIDIPGGRFEFSDEAGNLIETADTPGELVYYGANVMMGYAESGEDLVRGDEMGGRLPTGDLPFATGKGLSPGRCKEGLLGKDAGQSGNLRGGGGTEGGAFGVHGEQRVFLEYRARELREILPPCGERCQTISYYGVTPEEIGEFMRQCHPKGVDRVVPLGRTMDFDLIWFGTEGI